MSLSDKALLAEFYRRFGHKTFKSLEDLVTSDQGFGLTTATPVQRAICRIVDNKPLNELETDPAVASSLGLSPAELLKYAKKKKHPPREMVILSGIRTGKSMLAAAIAIWASQTCEMSHLRPGEIPRFSILSINKDLANVVMSHMMGNILASPILTRLIFDQDAARKWLQNGKPGTDSIMLRNMELNRPVEIKVVSGKRAGSSLVARWSCGVVADESPRMCGQDSAVVNLDDSRKAVLGRLLPGAGLYMIGSPWAPIGPVHRMYTESYGKPNREMVVLKAPGPTLNPIWWTPERCERLKDSDEEAYTTDVLAEFCDVEESLFGPYLDDATMEDMYLPYDERLEYICSIDPATRQNAFTMVIATRKGTKKIIVFAKQWQGTRLEPLRPSKILQEIAIICSKYELRWAITDQFAGDAMVDLAAAVGLELVIEEWTSKNKTPLFLELATQFQQGNVVIPPDHFLLKDLRLVKRRITQGGVSIVFPQTSDKRHCDYAPAIARAVSSWISDMRIEVPKLGDPGYGEFLAKQIEDEEDAKFLQREENQWWEQ